MKESKAMRKLRLKSGLCLLLFVVVLASQFFVSTPYPENLVLIAVLLVLLSLTTYYDWQYSNRLEEKVYKNYLKSLN